MHTVIHRKLALVLATLILFPLSARSEDAFNSIGKFSEGLAIAYRANDKPCYIDKTGICVIEPAFFNGGQDGFGDFHEGLAKFRNNDGFYGFMDKEGKWAVKTNAIEVSDFHDGFARFKLRFDGGYGYINKEGKPLPLPQIKYANEFHEGYSAARFSNYDQVDDRNGYIGKSGKVEIKPLLNQFFDFSEGLASNCDSPYFAGYSGKTRCGYIDKTGKWAIEPHDGWTYAGEFHEGFAVVIINDKTGFIDKSGKIVIEPQFKSVRNFSEGLASATINGSEWGYIDATGKFVIAPVFNEPTEFSEGLASVRIAGSCGYIDKSGKFVIEPQFNNAKPFANEFATVDVYGNDSNLINKSGKYAFQPYRVAKKPLLETYREKFASAANAKDFRNFVTQFKYYDPENLVAKAEARIKPLELAEAKQAEAQAKQLALEEAKRAKEQAAAEARLAKEEAARQAKERQQIAAFRKKVQDGDETNCGAVIESKPKMVKISFAVANYGNEHWIRREEIFPAGYGCRFINGQYQPPQ